MPEEILRTLFATPTCELGSFCLHYGHAQLYFIIDPVRDPSALVRLYQLGLTFEPMPLLLGTDLAPLASKGPFGFAALANTDLANAAAQLCVDGQCGIVFAGAEPQALLQHARSLLKVNDGSGGQSLLNLGNPYLWAALALTAGSSSQRLYGDISDVLSPAPRRLGVATASWYHWKAPANPNLTSTPYPLDLDPRFAATVQTLHTLYWIDEEHSAFGEPPGIQAPSIIANLEKLMAHGITEGRHLIKLGCIAKGPDLTNNHQAMSILQAREDDFIKVEKLIQLTETTGQ